MNDKKITSKIVICLLLLSSSSFGMSTTLATAKRGLSHTSFHSTGSFKPIEPLLMVMKTPSKAGIKLRMPERPHRHFVVSKNVYTDFNQRLLRDPFKLRKSCHEAYLPVFDLLNRDIDRKEQINKKINGGAAVILEEILQYTTGYEATLDLMLEKNMGNPLFTLGECFGGICRLSRREQKSSCPRESFIRQILDMTPVREEPKTVILYASGRCFFEMELLTRMIAAGHKIGTIILIDPYMKPMVQSLLRIDPDGSSLSIEYMLEKLNPVSNLLVFQVAQMLYSLNGLDNSVQALIYASYKHYLEDSSDKADMLIAMDYLGSEGYPPGEDRLLPELEKLSNTLKGDRVMGTAKVDSMDGIIFRALKIGRPQAAASHL